MADNEPAQTTQPAEAPSPPPSSVEPDLTVEAPKFVVVGRGADTKVQTRVVEVEKDK